MAAQTQSSKRCSSGSGRAFILRPERSRLLLGWVVGSHGLAAAALLHAPLGAAATALLLVALAGHAYWQWPRPLGRIVRSRSGSWALPDAGRTGLKIVPATRYGDWWVDLRLSEGRGSVRVLLCRDQLSPDAWRLLQATLRSESESPRLP